MRIIIDGDACPVGVKRICQTLGQQYKVKVLLVSDENHEFSQTELEDLNIIQVEQGRDAADYHIFGIAEAHDIIVTSDFGLAALLVDRVIAVISPSCFVYSSVNMSALLYRRYLEQRERKAGHGTRIKKRTKADDQAFEELLMTYIAPIV